MLTKSLPSRERILLYGIWGSGKTHAWATLTDHLRSNDPMPKVFVMDTDQTVPRTSEAFPLWSNNVTSTDLYGKPWGEYLKATVKYNALAGSDDWLVVDTADTAWDVVQGEFTEKAFGKEIDEWFLQFRRDNPTGGHALAGSYGINWSVINKMYAKWIMEVLRFPGHVILCCPADPVATSASGGGRSDSTEVLNLYGRIGWKPRGQKGLGYQVNTVLLMQDDGKGFRMTTVKDRGREKVAGMVVKDWTEDYLVKVGGWKLGGEPMRTESNDDRL